MENEYTLYLDESKTVDNIFVIGGFAIHISKEQELEEKLQKIKDRVWKNVNESVKKVFHATDYIKRYPGAFMDLIEIVRQVNGVVFATVIKLDELSELYGKIHNKGFGDEYCMVDDPFNIALEKIVENYTHFLYKNNGFGKTLYEARNGEGVNWCDSPDFSLKKDFLRIITNGKGIGYLHQSAIQLCNTNFSVRKKKEDVAGLQIADNIAYIIGRSMSPNLKENENIEKIFDEIFNLAYNGGYDRFKKDLRHFFGIKILPEMFRTIPMERRGEEQLKAYLQMEKMIEERIKELKNNVDLKNE